VRRFSQRSSLVTLSEINITPLLDLAFVLLIIFVITTPLLEQGIPLKLPVGGQPDRPVDRRNVRTIEISSMGKMLLDRKVMTLPQMEEVLVRDFKANTNLVVFIRADKDSRVDDLMAVVDTCRRHNITRMDFRTEPSPRK
jgi:biopolymer transport protein ExbD